MQHTGAIGIHGPVLRDPGGQWGREVFNMRLYINKNLELIIPVPNATKKSMNWGGGEGTVA